MTPPERRLSAETENNIADRRPVSSSVMTHTMRAFLVATTLFVAAAGCGSRQPYDTDEISETELSEADTEPMKTSLQTECRKYLETGPPTHMENYVPESLTEIIIAHGAKGESLDPELAEIGEIIVVESESLSDIEDPEIRDYMQNGADLVRRVLEANR